MKNPPVAKPTFAELFCVVCALPCSDPVATFCSKICEDAWVNYDSGKWDWAIFAEWSLS